MIKDFKDSEKFNGNLMINNFSKGVSNNGQPYLNITFQDASGNIEGKKWEINDKDLSLVEIGNIVYVNAEVLKYRDKNQLKVLTISESKGEIDLAEFVKSAPNTKEYYLDKINSFINEILYDDIKNIVTTILKEKQKEIMEYPAATRNHHDYYSGLLHHTTGMLELAKTICDLHSNVDRSMLYAGAILHDIGKTVEFSGPVLPKYTVEGKLLGHISIMNAYVKEVANKLNYDNERVMLLQHMILSHHGKNEFGSPIVPLTLEAEILSFIDNLDSRINMITKAVNDVNEGEFTNHQYGLEGRCIYKPHKE